MKSSWLRRHRGNHPRVVSRDERRLRMAKRRRDPRLTPADRQVLAAAEKLADNGCFRLDAETTSLLADPRMVLELEDGAR